MAIIDIWDNIAKQINDEVARIRSLEDSDNKVDEFIRLAKIASIFNQSVAQVITQINDTDLVELTEKGFGTKYGKIVKKEYYYFDTTEELIKMMRQYV